MPWVKLDDQLANHPKIAELGRDGPKAGWLYVSSLCYSAQHLTDGVIPSGQVTRLASFPPREAERLAGRLVDVGLWEQEAGRYRIHDYLVYNPSRDKVLDERKKREAAGRAGGLAKAQAHAKQSASATADEAQPSATDMSLAKRYTRTRTPEPSNEASTRASRKSNGPLSGPPTVDYDAITQQDDPAPRSIFDDDDEPNVSAAAAE